MDAKDKIGFINAVGAPGATVQESATASAPATQSQPQIILRQEDISNVFASGLPEWSVEPPMVMVRRKSRI